MLPPQLIKRFLLSVKAEKALEAHSSFSYLTSKKRSTFVFHATLTVWRQSTQPTADYTVDFIVSRKAGLRLMHTIAGHKLGDESPERVELTIRKGTTNKQYKRVYSRRTTRSNALRTETTWTQFNREVMIPVKYPRLEM